MSYCEIIFSKNVDQCAEKIFCDSVRLTQHNIHIDLSVLKLGRGVCHNMIKN